jgi:hypothetical protein
MKTMSQSYGHFISTMNCPNDGLQMPAVPPGGMTQCPHCGSVYRLDEMCELTLLESPLEQ